MQGGKNWILPKEIKKQSVSSEALIGWKSGKTTYVPCSLGPNGGSVVAMDSV
jgi:hypothetical protein